MNRGLMPASLAPMSLRLTTLRTWRDLQRFLATYPDPQKGWQGHLRVQQGPIGPKPAREGLALRVTQYEDEPNDDLPWKIEVQFASGETGECTVRQLQALGIVW